MGPKSQRLQESDMALTRLHVLPQELLLIIHGHLDNVSSLALDICLRSDQQETQLVHDFLKERMRLPVLAVQQIVHQTGARGGSYNWDQYQNCRTELYTSPFYRPNRHDWGQTPRVLQFKDVVEALSVSETIERLLARFKDNFTVLHQWYGENPDGNLQVPEAFAEPNNIELARMVLATYQYNAYCRLLGKGPDDLSFEEASNLATRFLVNLTPWEKEQIYCVSQSIVKEIGHMKKILLDDGRFPAICESLRNSNLPADKFPSKYYNSEPRAGDASRNPGHLWMRVPAYLPTTILWRDVFSQSSEPRQVRQQKLEDLMLLCKPVPWAVAIEKMMVVEYEGREVHPCASVFGLDAREAREQNLTSYLRLINYQHYADPDRAPFVYWEGNHRTVAPFTVTTTLKKVNGNLGWYFWTANRHAEEWTQAFDAF